MQKKIYICDNCGKPLVLTDEGERPGYWKMGDDGTICWCKDCKKIVPSVVQAIEDMEKRRALLHRPARDL